jgi:dTDP-glucose 4,6-dehydratase
MKILILGSGAFDTAIGSNFIPFFLDKNMGYSVVNLDILTYAGNLDNLEELENSSRYTFVKGDICDKKLVESIFKEYKIDAVIHFAA